MFAEAPFVEAVCRASEIHSRTGVLPALNDSRLNLVDVAVWEPWDGEGQLDALLATQETGNPIIRSVVGATLRFLTRRENDSDAQEVLARATERFTSYLPVRSIRELNQWRWEVHVAAANENLGRLLALGRCLEDLGGGAEHRGVLVRAAFVVGHPSHFEIDPSAVDPLIHAPDWNLEPVFDLNAHTLSTVVDKRPELRWAEPETFSSEELNALVDIDAHLRKLENEVQALTPTQRGIQCWCRFASAAAARDAPGLVAAGRLFSALPSPNGLAVLEWLKWRAAYRCFELASNWAAAETAARRWAEMNPQDAEAHHRVAQACHKQNDLPKTIEAYETFVRVKEESNDEWEPSLLLRLGLEVQSRSAMGHALERAAFAAYFRPDGERLTAWFMPSFEKLSREARQRWWVGLFEVSSLHVATEIGDARWGQAADNFGEAVAFELKAGVFGPFSRSFTGPSPDEHWRVVLRGKGTLGKLLTCLLQTQSRNSAPAKELAGWMRTNTPKFADYVSKMRRSDVEPLWTLRGEAQHGTIGETETRRVYALAVGLLAALSSDR